jgi:hypothetical protein
MGETMRTASLTICASAALALAATPVCAQVVTPKVDNVPVPAGVDVFNLDFDGIKKFSSVQNFEIVGHSYFKIDQRTPYAKGQGRSGPELGSGFNTARVYDGIGYFAGYNSPQTLFGVVIADVRDPRAMKMLSFIPCNPGTRCGYLRVDRAKKILIVGHDDNPRDNPTKVPTGEKTKPGWAFHDVSDPQNPKLLSFVPATPGGKTHGMEIDGRYLYGCGTFNPDMNREGLQIIDYGNPAEAKQVATWHVPGQIKGEQFGPLNRNNPDGKPQLVQCHEINYHNDRLYLAWRDAGMLVLDIKDRVAPKLLATYDYVPPYHGGFLGAAHSSLPIVRDPSEHPDIVVHTDEIFDCPQGFGRILDVSDLKNPEVARGERPANVQLLSTFRAEHVQDVFDPAKKEFVCPGTPVPNRSISNTTHLPMLDYRSLSLVYVNWYDEGVRVLDISNPSAPRFTGHFLSPRFAAPGREDRHTREIWQDPDSNLFYVTDGNGGGVTVLRYTGPIPPGRPIPGVR